MASPASRPSAAALAHARPVILTSILRGLSKLPPMDALEDAMLDSANERNETSRLTCQISMTDELDGLTVTVVPPY